MTRCKHCDCAHPADQTANPHYCIERLTEETEKHEKRIADLEAQLELKQGIIQAPAYHRDRHRNDCGQCDKHNVADETRMKLLEAELTDATQKIRQLEAALAKAEGTSDDFD